MFEIKTKILSTMNGLWLQLDHYQNLKMKESEDAQVLK